MDRPKRTWLCTLNNPELTLEQVHQRTEAAYTVGQLEQGANGTLHLQFVQNFKIPRRLAHYKKHLPQAHCEPVLVDNGVDKYCMKQETRVDGPWEYLKPDVMVILSLSREKREERNSMRGELENPDTFESRGQDFQKKVDDGYLEIAEAYGIPVISADGTIDEVHDMLIDNIEKH